jgi:hypothetical protein
MNEQIQLLEQALERLAEAAALVRQAAADESVRRTVLPQLEGRDAGWLGTFAVDLLRDYIQQLEAEVSR